MSHQISSSYSTTRPHGNIQKTWTEISKFIIQSNIILSISIRLPRWNYPAIQYHSIINHSIINSREIEFNELIYKPLRYHLIASYHPTGISHSVPSFHPVSTRDLTLHTSYARSFSWSRLGNCTQLVPQLHSSLNTTNFYHSGFWLHFVMSLSWIDDYITS